MKPRNPELNVAVKQWAKAALEEVWPKNEDEARQRGRAMWAMAQDTFWFSSERLHDRPEFRGALANVTGYSVIARQLDVLVGTESGKSRWTAEEVLDRVVIAVLVGKPEDLEAIEQSHAVDDVYGQMEQSFYQDDIELTAVLPLEGLNSKGELLDLPNDVRLTRITNAERQVIEYPAGMLDMDLHPAHDWCFRKTLRFPKLIESSQESNVVTPEASRELEQRESVADLLQSFVEFLRVWKEGNVSGQRVLFASDNWLVRGTGIIPARRLGRASHSGRYDLKRDELPELEKFLRNVCSENVRKSRPLRVAIQRFASAAQRGNDEDRLIDLMISAEALLLAGEGQGELTYRLSTNAAALLGRDTDERLHLAKLFRRLYKERSAVVHGGELDANRVRQDVPEGVEAMRRVLHKAVDHTASHGSWAIEWDALLFGSQEE